MSREVLQSWVTRIPIRAQGTLLTGTRGCDLAPKNPFVTKETEDEIPERTLVAYLRYCCFNPADTREIDIPGAWMRSSPPNKWKPSQFGHYPIHWYSHLMHCFEIIGQYHYDNTTRATCEKIYVKLVRGLHLNPERPSHLVKRLMEDRIASGNIVS